MDPSDLSLPPLAAAFVFGLLGGAHCIGMCGGITIRPTLDACRKSTPSFRTWLDMGLDALRADLFDASLESGRVRAVTRRYAPPR